MADGINKVVASKPIESLLTNFSAVEKKLFKKMVISNAKKSPVIHLTVTDDVATGTCKSLNLMVKQATAAPSQHLQTEATDLSFSHDNKKTPNSMPANQEPLLSRPVKTKRGYAPK